MLCQSHWSKKIFHTSHCSGEVCISKYLLPGRNAACRSIPFHAHQSSPDHFMDISENQSHTSFSCVLSSCNEQPRQLTAGDVGESNALTGSSECLPKEKGSAPGSDPHSSCSLFLIALTPAHSYHLTEEMIRFVTTTGQASP